MTPQIIYLLLVGIGLGVDLANHGKEKTGKENFFVSLGGVVLVLFILYYGGFFNCFFR